jgi:hypothetical protein
MAVPLRALCVRSFGEPIDPSESLVPMGAEISHGLTSLPVTARPCICNRR